MSAVDELCALGFEKYWVNQALELTNHNQEYALEWLLSDEFKLAKEQFDRQRRQFQKKQTPHGIAMPETTTKTGKTAKYNDNDNPLLIDHKKEPSLQSMPQIHSKSNGNSKEQEQDSFDYEYDPNQPDLKPNQSLADFKKAGINKNALFKNEENNSDSDSGDGIDQLLQGPQDLNHEQSSPMQPDPQERDPEMQGFLDKLRSQVFISLIIYCHSFANSHYLLPSRC